MVAHRKLDEHRACRFVIVLRKRPSHAQRSRWLHRLGSAISPSVLREENHSDYEKGYGPIQRRETHDCKWLNPPHSKVFGRHISKFGQVRVRKK